MRVICPQSLPVRPRQRESGRDGTMILCQAGGERPHQAVPRISEPRIERRTATIADHDLEALKQSAGRRKMRHLRLDVVDSGKRPSTSPQAGSRHRTGPGFKPLDVAPNRWA
jgi:hypothetical protein